MDDATPQPWSNELHREALVLAADIIDRAEVILIGAGAGMSVDSGLPDFRSPRGFWKAYPPAEALGFCYEDVAGGPWFVDDPEMAWGFVLHCEQIFEGREPHEGYHILKRWVDEKATSWVYTSNIDHYFIQTGFDPERTTHIHGWRNFAQCVKPCSREIWPIDMSEWRLDQETLRMSSPLPRCPRCGALARPNTLMFNDNKWIGDKTRAEENLFTTWLNAQLGRRVAVIELGAGGVVPNVRFQCERYAKAFGTPLIRINPGEPEVPDGAVSLPLPALQALRSIDGLMRQMRA